MARVVSGLAIALLVASGTGCGSSSGGDGPPRPGMGGAAGTGGAAGSGGDGGTGLTQSGGAAGSGGVGATGGSVSGCDSSGFEVDGQLDGQPLHAFIHDSNRMATWAVYHPGWRAAILGSGASLLMGGEQPSPSMGEEIVGDAWIMGPAALPFAATQLRAAKVTASFGDLAAAPIVLEQLEAIGPCPGTPVSGSLEVCLSDTLTGCGADGQARASLHGTLDGVAIDSVTDNGAIFLPEFERSASSLDDAWVLAIHSASAGLATIIVPAMGGSPAQLICVEAGQRSDDGTVYRFDATKVSRAGTAPGTPVAGSLTLTKCP